MATWCIATGQSDEAYRRLTYLERIAFVDAVRRQNKRR